MGDSTNNMTRRILAGIACEVGHLAGTIAMMQEARDKTERPEVRREIHITLLDEISRRSGLYRALRIAAAVVDLDATGLAEIADDVGAQRLTDELRRETAAGKELANV
jgi:hypothetical protein